MQPLKHIVRQRWIKVTAGVAVAEYLRLVGKTTRFIFEPEDIHDRLDAETPVILATWHGQHLLAPTARKVWRRMKVLVSRHHDGDINAVAATRLGLGTIRGSGNHRSGFLHKGGVAAFQGMLGALADGYSVALSADVPKISRVAGLGIIKLAQASGRPIYAGAVASNRRLVLDNWDHTTINLPFGRAAGVAAEPVNVPADADAAALEELRRLLEDRLTAATRRAYELVDRPHRGD